MSREEVADAEMKEEDEEEEQSIPDPSQESLAGPRRASRVLEPAGEASCGSADPRGDQDLPPNGDLRPAESSAFASHG